MIVDRDSAAEYMDAAVDPSQWTALIPAAGRGSRLGFDKPKILFPIAGHTILEWLLDLLRPLCSHFVFVLSAEGKEAVSPLLPGDCRIAVQKEPRGMADAIACGLPLVETANVLIIWGDQVALEPASLDLAMRVHQGPARPDATCPTLWRDKPYIHFERDAEGRVSRVLQAREGDTMPLRGESDCGVFLFTVSKLRQLLKVLLESKAAVGSRTGEFNFLPIFPMLDRLITMPIMTEAQSVGVNSRADAEFLERHLLARKAGAW